MALSRGGRLCRSRCGAAIVDNDWVILRQRRAGCRAVVVAYQAPDRDIYERIMNLVRKRWHARHSCSVTRVARNQRADWQLRIEALATTALSARTAWVKYDPQNENVSGWMMSRDQVQAKKQCVRKSA